MKPPILFLFSALLAAAPPCVDAAAPRPNVILILADDMATGDLGSRNGGLSRTPNLDRLERESAWFSSAYSASPVCAPARASLLTGRFPHRTGVVTLNMEKHPPLTRLRKDETTLAQAFKAAGYTTGLIGKWHLGIGKGYHPLERGFDEFEGFIGHLYVPSYSDYRLDVQRETKAFKDRYLTTDLSQRALAFVRRHRDKPFFLHLAHYAPHRPIEAPEERVRAYLDRGLQRETATAYAMLEIMDEGIGSLLAALEELGLRRRTIVIFASDNGPDPLVEERFNLGFRGGKYTVDEGGLRVPFMLSWPGRIPPGERTAPIHFIDVMPTLMDLCGLPSGEGLRLDGISLRPLLTGTQGELPSRSLCWQWNRYLPRYSHNAAIREGRWKLVRPFVTRNIPKGQSSLPPQLFDLSTDTGERHDISASHGERVARMQSALEAWCREVERDRTR